MEESFVLVTTNIGPHSIFLHHFLTLCMMFFPRFYIPIFKQNTLKIPSKPREKKGKVFDLHAYFWDLMMKDSSCDSNLIWWFHLSDKISTPFLPSSNTLQKKTSLREALGYVIFACPDSILCHCARDGKSHEVYLNIVTDMIIGMDVVWNLKP